MITSFISFSFLVILIVALVILKMHIKKCRQQRSEVENSISKCPYMSSMRSKE